MFKPGDKVICIDNNNNNIKKLILHNEYTIKDYVVIGKKILFSLEEVGTNSEFYSERFVLASVFNYRKDFEKLINE